VGLSPASSRIGRTPGRADASRPEKGPRPGSQRNQGQKAPTACIGQSVGGHCAPGSTIPFPVATVAALDSPLTLEGTADWPSTNWLLDSTRGRRRFSGFAAFNHLGAAPPCRWASTTGRVGAQLAPAAGAGRYRQSCAGQLAAPGGAAWGLSSPMPLLAAIAPRPPGLGPTPRY